eukprot:TRINITY_DN3838_c0_g5_i1.p1 TRINITY_DN3838_c0_g5~~TRINITY_DN3838_c0_g5_i1.p1  ORF type:complete len:248 (+),score=52.77 TRINITY_DN3838_c0_g5_i1:73-816(+)
MCIRDRYIIISMGSLVVVFLHLLLASLAISSTDCKFKLPDESTIDLSSFRKEKPPDYTYSDDNVFYVINLCAPTIKLCNGVEGSFASVWNASTYACIRTIGEGSPTAAYIDGQNKFKGVALSYGSAAVQIACDQGYNNGALVDVQAKEENGVKRYTFHFKTKLVCGNYTGHLTDGWSGVAIIMIILLVSIFIYVGYGAYMSTRSGQYTGFRDVLPQKEFVMNIALKGKEMANKVFGSSDSNNNSAEA